jgi:LytS/YehU family sensor histidine kinase
VEPGLETVRVPRLLLQPLVENALKHGLGEGCGRLHVDVRRDGRCLRYTVSDDGAGLTGAPIAPGTGLSNISRRLELLFPGDHSFELAACTPRGVVVTVQGRSWCERRSGRSFFPWTTFSRRYKALLPAAIRERL